MSPRAEEVRKTAAAIRALHRHTLEATADVASRDDIRRLVDAMRKEFGRDILVNSAGTSKRSPLPGTDRRGLDPNSRPQPERHLVRVPDRGPRD